MHIVLGVAAFAALLVLAGVVYERLGQYRAARDFPPPGKMVDIGGRRIQLDCRGAGSPTVVFEAGLSVEGSLSWSAVQPKIADHTRACAYSRAGLMWSDSSGAPHSAKQVAQDLHAALTNAESERQTPHASIVMRTWPRPGSGSSRSTMLNGPPGSAT